MDHEKQIEVGQKNKYKCPVYLCTSSYKEEEGLNDELAKVTKDGQGLLGKKDFLNRCDVRKFEQERDHRLAQAAKNTAPGKKQ